MHTLTHTHTQSWDTHRAGVTASSLVGQSRRSCGVGRSSSGTWADLEEPRVPSDLRTRETQLHHYEFL